MIRAEVRVVVDKRSSASALLNPVTFGRFLERLATELHDETKAWARYYIYDTPESPGYKRTWRLYNTLRKAAAGYHRWMLESGVSYGIYVHEGTRHMSPRPYLVMALRALHRKVVTIANDFYRSIR